MEWENSSYIIKHRAEKVFSIARYVFLIPVGFILILLICFQIFLGQYFYNLAEQNRSRMFITFAPRGAIYDCNNVLLTDNRPWIRVFYYPFEENKMESVQTILDVLPESKKKLFYGIKTQRIVSLSEDLSRDKLFKLLSLRHRLSGILVTTEFRRRYLYNETFAHLIGYIGELTYNEYLSLKSLGYKYTDFVGKAGVEKVYESYLRGTHGALVMEVDAYGNPTRLIKKIPPLPGYNIQLTVDAELQKVARQALAATGKNGAIVGIDPRNGAVRILVSYKDFDPNMFISLSSDRKTFLTDKNLPLLNRCLQGMYPPGSVFKPLIAIAALNENYITPTSFNVYCKGEFVLGNKIFKCWEKKGHGYMNLHNAMRLSCDVYFYNLALKLGIDNIEKYSKMFGFGTKTGIDLPYEQSAVCPSKKWKLEKLKTAWFDGDTVNVGIGQGYITVTPLQLAVFTSAIANRGIIYQPYTIEKIIDLKGNVIYKPDIVKKNVLKIREDVWNIIEESMISVVNSGTGYAAHIPNITLAGKTGTAQNPHGADHALFICYGPIKKGEIPPLAIAIVVEHGGKGGAVAAPIAKEIFSAFIGKNNSRDTASVWN